MCRIRKAGITIYAALILEAMLALVITCLTSARMAAARAQIAVSAEAGLFSLFAGYDRQLLDEFEIFGLNVGGSPEAGDLAAVCNTTEHYMKQVLNENSQNLKLQKTGLSGYRLLTDDGGEPFYRQAVLYEKEKGTKREEILKLQRWKEALPEIAGCREEGENEEASDWFGRYDAAIEEAYRLSLEALEASGEEYLTSEEEPQELSSGFDLSSVYSPVPVIGSIHASGIISLLLAGEEIIPANLTLPLLSERSMLQGMGIMDGFQTDNTAEAELLFQGYICEKLGNYLKPGKDFPVYQMEYVLEGEKTEGQNLEKVVNKILMIRVGAALRFIDGDGDSGEQLDRMTSQICSPFLVPPDSGVIRGTLRFCWALGNAICELSSLLAGGKIPLETPSELRVPLEGLYTLQDYLGKPEDNGGLCSYEEYLGVLMLELEKPQKLMRTMECVESAVRSSGRSFFYLDHCMTDAEISADVRANGRKTFTVTKSYGYS